MFLVFFSVWVENRHKWSHWNHNAFVHSGNIQGNICSSLYPSDVWLFLLGNTLWCEYRLVCCHESLNMPTGTPLAKKNQKQKSACCSCIMLLPVEILPRDWMVVKPSHPAISTIFKGRHVYHCHCTSRKSSHSLHWP